MLDLLHHFRSKGIHAVGATRLNHSRDFPLDPKRNLVKNGRGAVDYLCDNNSGKMAVKWVDNNVVNLASNFVRVEPVWELKR